MPCVPKSTIIQNLGLQETVNLAAGAVPSVRRVNGYPLSADIALTAKDVSAIPMTGSTDITGPLRTTGEVQSSTPNGFRIAYGGYGAFWRNDSANLYLMLTDNGDPYGSYNGLRPFRVDLAKGNVSIGTPLYVASTIRADKGVQSGYVGSYAFSAQFATGAAFYETFNTTGVSEYHPLLKQKATITNKAAWTFSYGSLCDNGRLSWCLHMIDGGGRAHRHDWDINGNYLCPGQLIPASYANFDARYIQNVRVGAVGTFVVAKNTWREAPVGAFMTGWYTEGSEPGGDTVRYRPLQILVNGTWRTIAA